MINVGIKIGSGQKVDSYAGYGLIYIGSTHILSAPIKEMESSSYPEEAGEHLLNKTVKAPFDFTVTFFIEGNVTGSTPAVVHSINERINTFNSNLYTTAQGSDVLTLKKIEFTNPAKSVKIVGYPTPISEASELWVDQRGVQHNAAKVELKIRVTNPNDCNFNYSEP